MFSNFNVVLAVLLGAALQTAHLVVAAPTVPYNAANVNVGPVAVGNVGGSNAHGSNVAGSNAENLAVGSGSHYDRRRTGKTQPQYINSPQATNQGSCSVGTAQCCQSLHQTQDLASQGVVGGLLAAGLPLDDLMVGVQCTPIANVIPIVGGSDSCHSQPVCCTGNK
ncbi:hypothetical protein FRC17_006565 [Serendipita sp. 399]|nr:hypothetical protein FRC17_006565 [Serendipita sp. 399]